MHNKASITYSAISYVLMIYVNYLANSLPINNRTTGQISESYPNLFTPSGFTFSIWGVIYLFLFGYIIFQFTRQGQKRQDLHNRINPFFVATSVINICWILAWHYDYIAISVVLMVILLSLLIKIAGIVKTDKFTIAENVLIRTPFSIYFGWITVALIANITVFLVKVGWNGFGISDYIWTSIILFVGALIGASRVLKDRNIVYGLVLIWAYFGILVKHTSVAGFNGQYPIIVATVLVCLFMYLFFIGRLFFKKN